MTVLFTRTFLPSDTTGIASTAGVSTYSSISIGTASADRIVVLGVVTEASGATINSATIDYGSGDIAMDPGPAGLLANQNIKIFTSTNFVTTGTTATFKITYGAAVTGGAGGTNNICVYAVTGASINIVEEGVVNDTDADPITTAAISVPTGGGLFVICNDATDSTARTWTGASAASPGFDADGGAMRFGAGTAGAGSVTVTVSGANGEDATLAYTVFIPTPVNFGDLIGAAGNDLAAIANPLSPTQHLSVAVGDLVFVATGESSALTSVGCSDNLGNSFTPLTSGTSTNANVKAYFSLITVAGDCTPAVVTTPSSNDATIIVTAYKGPFNASPLDKNPAVLSDTATAYVSNLTGTLSQADELIIGYFASSSVVTYSTPTATVSGTARLDSQRITPAVSIGGCVTSIVVGVDTTQAMSIAGSASNPTACGIATFKKSTGVAPSTVTESITTTDAQSAKFGPAKKSLSESITATDTQTRIRYTRSTAAETLTLTDTTNAIKPVKATAAETLSLTDTQTGKRTTRATAAETLVFTDTQTTKAIFKSTAAESLNIVDTHTARKRTLSTAAEVLALTDNQTARQTSRSTAAESLILVDTATASSGKPPSFVTETLTLTDTQSTKKTTRATAIESLTLSDTQSTIKTSRSTAAETIVLTDNQSARQTSRATIAESLVLVDTSTAVSGKLPSSVTETLTLTDTQSARRRSLSTAAETLTLSDTQSAKQTSRSTAAETLTPVDSQTARQRTQLFVTETLTLADQQFATSAHAATASNVSETLTITDTQSARTRTLVTGTETISLSDNQTRLRTTKATAAESITLTDAQTGRRIASVSDAETIAPADTQSARLNALARTAETIALLDSQIARERTSANTTETLSLVDATDGSVLAAGIAQCPENISPLDHCDATVIAGARDTHDGFVKKKKKKKKIDEFAEEIDRREKLRKQITEVIHPPEVPFEEPEVKLPEIVEAKPFEIKTKITPAVDYAGLAKEEIVAKLRKDAELKAKQEFERQKEEARQLELKRLADIEDEDELEMILEALL